MGDAWEFSKEVIRCDPVGFCIYCGIAENLSDEHVIAYSLGGNLILPKSSCRDCATLTSRFERGISKGMLGNFRATHEFPSRKKANRRKYFDLYPINDREDQNDETGVLLKDYPSDISLPKFAPPSILSNNPGVRDQIKIVEFPRVNIRPGNIEYDEYSIGMFAIDDMVKMLAKIGHSFAISQIGIEEARTFMPYLPNIIRGSEKYYSYVIDSDDKSIDTYGEKGLHVANIDFIKRGVLEILVVNLKLFAFPSMPIYKIVFGVRNAAGPRPYRWPPILTG